MFNLKLALSKLVCLSSKFLVFALLLAGMALNFAREANAQAVQDLNLDQQIELDLNEVTAQRLRFEDLRIDVQVVDPSAEEFDEFIRVIIAQKGGKSYQRDFETSFARYLTVGAFSIDRDGTPSIVLQNYTGGAHCCMEVVSLYLGIEWREEELALVDGGTIHPTDYDADGLLEFVIPDGRFFYTFDAYAFSTVPSLVIATQGGQYLDMTGSGAYEDFLSKEFYDFMSVCLDDSGELGTNSGCASLLAVAARMGVYEGTMLMVRNIYEDRVATDGGWTEFTINQGTDNQTFGNLPDAVDAALVYWGILK